MAVRATASASGTADAMQRPPVAQAASSSTSSTAAKTTVAKNSSKSKDNDSKIDVNGPLAQATYTVAPPLTKQADCSSDSAPARAASQIAALKRSPAEAKSPPVNLGVLRLLNSKRITFHFEVKDAGSSGVAAFELWGTKDMRSWRKYDIVAKTPKSLMVEVKEEGLYGFTMIARGKTELTKDQAPLPGEAPQVWVAVDLTKPDVALLGAELNIMSPTPALVIRWTAKDTNFGPKPITLLYAERLEGPWVPIAANMQNGGRYDWNMPGCVPATVYVRVQANDMMGNMGMAQTTALHIPGRSPVAQRGEPTTTEPPRLVTVPTPPALESTLRPVAAAVPNPAVSILSVEGE